MKKRTFQTMMAFLLVLSMQAALCHTPLNQTAAHSSRRKLQKT